MKSFLCVALLCLTINHQANAQMRKCVAPDGRITFSDVTCPGNSKSAQTLNERYEQPNYENPSRNSPTNRPAYPPQSQAPAATGPTQAQIYERQLTGKISGYLASGDIETAAGLAITPEHHTMIERARQNQERASRAFDANKRANEAAKRDALPYECKTTTTRTPWDYNNRSTTTTKCGRVEQ